MATAVIMPKVDMDQETGTIVEWLKKNGDWVEKDEIILIIETDKVAIDVESPATGILQGIQAKPEEVIPIGRTIAYILEPGEQLPDEAKPQDQKSSVSPQPVMVKPENVSAGFDATPVAQNIAKDHDIDLRNIVGTGPHGKITKQDVRAALATKPSVMPGNGRVYATPAAKRIAREREVDLKNIIGSGPGLRIQAADVLGVHVPASNFSHVSGTGEEVIPLQGMRRTIAERMTVSYQSTPHISFTVKVDACRLNNIRQQFNNKAESDNQSKVSVTALLVKTVAWALTRHPRLNSSLMDDQIHISSEINIGVAVALAEGLIVPVVHNANQKGIGVIAAEVNDLATRARQGKLASTDVAGGTFTISNLGPFGIEQFNAIINPPQAAILAVGTTQLEAVVEKNERIVARPVMRMTLSIDHRVADGAMAAYFLNDLRDALESPELLLW
jgi:pyruvate dehydrogenase E2 component (dihydrolipoamide acetyltransferase)